MQLYLAWNPMRKAIKLSIKNTSSMLLESFRRLKVTMKMYPKVQDIQRYILNDKVIVAEVMIKGKRNSK